MRALRFSRGIFVCSGSIDRIFGNASLSAALNIFENFLFIYFPIRPPLKDEDFCPGLGYYAVNSLERCHFNVTLFPEACEIHGKRTGTYGKGKNALPPIIPCTPS